MISHLSDANRYALQQPHSQHPRGPAHDAHAPAGYQGSRDGLSAGERVQISQETDTNADHQRGENAHAEDPYTPRDASSDARRGESQGSSGDPQGPEDQLEVSPEERRQIQQLTQRDKEVRTHELAHAAAGGRYAGQPRYSYERGPDGRQYATGGEVSIDASPIPGDPEATIDKMRVVRRAALAPAQPSAQDRRVAAEAVQTEAQARRELSEQRQAEREELAESAGGGAGTDSEFTAADVGQQAETPNASTVGQRSSEPAGATIAGAVNRARGSQAFSGLSAFGRRTLADAVEEP